MPTAISTILGFFHMVVVSFSQFILWHAGAGNRPAGIMARPAGRFNGGREIVMPATA